METAFKMADSIEIDKKLFENRKLAQSDFQRQLYTWFQNKGMIDKLVSFLRSQMVFELQANSADLKMNAIKQGCTSPKMQAIKLLISDFLLQHEFLFTLSVFVSEVPSLGTLTEFNRYVYRMTEAYHKYNKLGKPRFQSNDVQDILEALGFKCDSMEIQNIRHMYQNNSDGDALLSCIIRMLPTFIQKYCVQEIEVQVLKGKYSCCKNVIQRQQKYIEELQGKLKCQEIYCKEEKFGEEMRVTEERIKELLFLLDIQKNSFAKKEMMFREKQMILKSRLKAFEEETKKEAEKQKKELKLHVSLLAQWMENVDKEMKKNYQHLQEEKEQLRKEKLEFQLERRSFEEAKSNFERSVSAKYEQKLCKLQTELKDINDTLFSKKSLYDKYTQCAIENVADNTNYSSYNKELSDFVQMQDELKCERELRQQLEQESAKLKSNWEIKCGHLDNITKEINELKNKCNILHQEINSVKQVPNYATVDQLKFLSLPVKFLTNKKRVEREVQQHSVAETGVQSLSVNLEFSSGNNDSSKDSITEGIVADAKLKLQALEKENEVINKNFRKLQDVLSRSLSTRNIDRLDFRNVSPRNESALNSPSISYRSKLFRQSQQLDSSFSGDPDTDFTSPVEVLQLEEPSNYPFRKFFMKHRSSFKLDKLYDNSAENSPERLSVTTHSNVGKNAVCTTVPHLYSNVSLGTDDKTAANMLKSDIENDAGVDVTSLTSFKKPNHVNNTSTNSRKLSSTLKSNSVFRRRESIPEVDVRINAINHEVVENNLKEHLQNNERFSIDRSASQQIEELSENLVNIVTGGEEIANITELQMNLSLAPTADGTELQGVTRPQTNIQENEKGDISLISKYSLQSIDSSEKQSDLVHTNGSNNISTESDFWK